MPKNTPVKENPQGETRRRLLEAASEIFAENGYRHTTFREICRRAGANNAAVNYHFHGKEQFYAAVIEYTLERTPPFFSEDQLEPGASPEDQLRHFIRTALSNLLGAGSPTRLLKLMSKEMIEPTPALALIVEKIAVPMSGILKGIVAKIVGKKPESRQVDDCARSIIAQISTLHQSKAIIQRISPYKEYDQETIKHLADHIAEFSLGALRAIADHRKEAGKKDKRK